MAITVETRKESLTPLLFKFPPFSFPIFTVSQFDWILYYMIVG